MKILRYTVTSIIMCQKCKNAKATVRTGPVRTPSPAICAGHELKVEAINMPPPISHRGTCCSQTNARVIFFNQSDALLNGERCIC